MAAMRGLGAGRAWKSATWSLCGKLGLSKAKAPSPSPCASAAAFGGNVGRAAWESYRANTNALVYRNFGTVGLRTRSCFGDMAMRNSAASVATNAELTSRGFRARHAAPGAAWGASSLFAKGIHSSGADEENSAAAKNLDAIIAQDSVDLSAIGDVGTIVDSSIREVELALIANSGYWAPVEACYNFFYFLHSNLDLPWVGAVAGGVLFIRMLLAPLNVEQMRMAERMAIAKPEIDRLSAEAKEAVAQGKDGSHYSTEVQKLWAKHGIHPGRTLLVNLVNLPVMLLLPFSIINLPKLGLPSLQAESFLWMSDISAADPYYVLPTTASILLFGAIHFNMSPEAMTPQMRQILPVFKILPIAFLPISVTLPAIFHVFALTSIVFQTTFSAVMRAIKKTPQVPASIIAQQGPPPQAGAVPKPAASTTTDASRRKNNSTNNKRKKKKN